MSATKEQLQHEAAKLCWRLAALIPGTVVALNTRRKTRIYKVLVKASDRYHRRLFNGR